MDETQRPADTFSRELSKWLDYQLATRVGPTIVQHVSFVGNVETWTVQTVRAAEMGEGIFLQRISPEGSIQLAIPPKVAETIARQHDQISTKNRRRGARQAIETRRAAGQTIGNPDALRRARKAKRKK